MVGAKAFSSTDPRVRPVGHTGTCSIREANIFWWNMQKINKSTSLSLMSGLLDRKQDRIIKNKGQGQTCSTKKYTAAPITVQHFSPRE